MSSAVALKRVVDRELAAGHMETTCWILIAITKSDLHNIMYMYMYIYCIILYMYLYETEAVHMGDF